ncbi:MAG: hypothetical protein AAF701_08220, partial [Pseudomonadota bacterium]
MMRFVAIGFLLAGCSAAQQAVDDLAREQAKKAVNTQAAAVLPGIDLRFATDCIIDQATSREILSLAQASVTGLNAASG